MPAQKVTIKEGLPKELREVFQAFERRWGTLARSFVDVLSPYAEHETLRAGHLAMETALGRSRSVEPTLRILATIKVALLLGCRVCAEGGAVLGKGLGLSQEKLAALVDHASSPMFSAREKLVLDYATAVSLPPRQVPAALRERLAAELSREQLVEIAATIAMEHYRVHFRKALLESEDEEGGTTGFCIVPPASPGGTER